MKKLEEKTQEGKLYKYRQLHLFLKDKTDLFKSEKSMAYCSVLMSDMPFKPKINARTRGKLGSYVKRLNEYYKGELYVSVKGDYARFTYRNHPTERKANRQKKYLDESIKAVAERKKIKSGAIIRGNKISNAQVGISYPKDYPPQIVEGNELNDVKQAMVIREPVKPDESYEPTFELTIKDGSVFFLFVLLGAIGGFLLTLYLFV